VSEGKPTTGCTITIVTDARVPPDQAVLVSLGCPRCHGRVAYRVDGRLECPSCGAQPTERAVASRYGARIPIG